MDLNKKLEYLKQHIDGIVNHTDEDAGVRLEALNLIDVLVEDGKAQITAELAAKKSKLTFNPSPAPDA